MNSDSVVAASKRADLGKRVLACFSSLVESTRGENTQVRKALPRMMFGNREPRTTIFTQHAWGEVVGREMPATSHHTNNILTQTTG
jgi:hypothetical protein